MVRSEWIKSWSLRSTWWVVAMSIVLMAGFADLIAAVMRTVLDDPDILAQMEQGAAQQGPGGGFGLEGAFNGAVLVTIGYQFAMLTVAVLGVLSISNEYRSGMIRATLVASPRRLRVLWSKLLVLITLTLIIAVVGIALAWVVTDPILAGINNPTGVSFQVDFADTTQIRQMLGAVLFLVIVAIMSFALGALLRATAGGIFAAVALLFVIPLILGIIVGIGDVKWVQTIFKYLPSQAGGQLVYPSSAPGQLDTWMGGAVAGAYAVVIFIAAAISMKRRDA
jgi:ABC-2 type transport system permease protein